jgi:hypothetical protein
LSGERGEIGQVPWLLRAIQFNARTAIQIGIGFNGAANQIEVNPITIA